MSRQFAFGLAAVVAIGASLAMSAPAHAFFGGSSGGSHGGFFGGSHGGSFGGLFHGHHGSNGSHGGYSNNCGCDCDNSEEASEGNHVDNDHHEAVSDRDDRVMEAPSRDVRHETRVNVYEGDRNGRRVVTRLNRDSNRNDRDDKDVKKDDDKEKDKNKDKKEEAKK